MNILAFGIMYPASFILSPRWFHKLNVFMIRFGYSQPASTYLTNLPEYALLPSCSASDFMKETRITFQARRFTIVYRKRQSGLSIVYRES